MTSALQPPQHYCPTHHRYYDEGQTCNICEGISPNHVNPHDWSDTRYEVIEVTHRNHMLDVIVSVGKQPHRRIIAIEQVAGFIHIIVEKTDYVHSSHRATEA